MTKKTRTRTRTTDFSYTVSFDSPIPTGWRHRNTRWFEVINAMNKVYDGTYKNARFDIPDHNGNSDEITAAINSLRGAVYRWADVVELDKDTYKVRTASGFTKANVPYLVAWIEEVD